MPRAQAPTIPEQSEAYRMREKVVELWRLAITNAKAEREQANGWLVIANKLKDVADEIQGVFAPDGWIDFLRIRGA